MLSHSGHFTLITRLKLSLAAVMGFSAVFLIGSVNRNTLAAQTPAEKLEKLKKFLEKAKGKAEPKADPKTDAKSSPSKGTDDSKPLSAEQVAFFEKKIRPVLVDKCYSCHAVDTPKGAKGGLTLDTRDGLRKGGDNGPAVVPGNSKKSLIVMAIKGEDLSQMPPKEKLSADVIADFEKWIQMGAPDPRSGKAAASPKPIDIAKGKEHWAFRAVKQVPAPTVEGAWASSDIDRFVQKKRDEQKLTPVADADKLTLVRRVYFDLIGLPPTPGQVNEFMADASPDAYAKLVDKLLAMPQYGEKWARHWLDVARYAESSGKEQNVLYPFAWRYRDYVIAAFNKDKPYDQFLREQIAGDLLPAKNDTDKAEKMIATGYLAIGPKSHNERNTQQFRLDVADEQIDAMSQGMLGLTIACARCHDHKFDPIPTKDYYALAGIFTSTETKFGTAALLISRNSAPLAELPAKADVPAGNILSAKELESMRERLVDLKKRSTEAQEQARKNKMPPVQLVVLNAQIGTIEKQLSYYDDKGNIKKMAMAVADRSSPKDSPVHIRGELDKTGDIVPRGMPQVIRNDAKPIGKNESGRKELADWVASKQNPLTARVMVNRVWQHLFGQGIVTTPDNFGTTGQSPSHPELLDYLAARFMKNNWSVKTLIRELVMTRTYRMASTFNEVNAATDPDNTYLWRMSKRRLDAEAIRDAMYAVSGQLDDKPADGSPVNKHEGLVQGLQRFFGGVERLTETNKRAIYIPIVRDNVPEVLELFDFAEPSLVTGSRDDTSVPAQGLYLMNNPQVMKLAEKFADKLVDRSSETERIDLAFRMAFGRPATPKEAAAAEAFLKKFIAAETKPLRKKSDVEKSAWNAFAQALFAAAEFRYLD